MTQTALVAAGPHGGDLIVGIGPQPGAHGMLRLSVELDGERVLSAEPDIGFMHRGAEKLCEVRDYRQVLALANRHEWLSAFPGELGVALLVEDALGLTVPERATWLRTLLVELNRILAHLVFLGEIPRALGVEPALPLVFAQREHLQAVIEELTGARVHHMFACVGGVKADVPGGWVQRARSALASVRSELPRLGDVVDHRLVRSRLRGAGVIAPELVDGYGLSGPLARASGVDRDLRRDAPSLGYGEIFTADDVVIRTEGDALARYEVLADQVAVSVRLAEACLDRLDGLGPGEVNVRLPKVLRVPEGEYHQESENPLGVAGYYLVSRGEKTPWRLKMRTPSFAHLSALPAILPGTHLDDLPVVLASMLYVIGDADR